MAAVKQFVTVSNKNHFNSSKSQSCVSSNLKILFELLLISIIYLSFYNIEKYQFKIVSAYKFNLSTWYQVIISLTC